MPPPAAGEDLAQARALRHAGRLEAARDAYRRAVEADGADAAALGELGLVEHQLGAAATGYACIERALAIEPRNAELRMAQGALLREAGDAAGAAAALQQAVTLAPDNAAAWQRLGSCLIELGRRHLLGERALRAVVGGHGQMESEAPTLASLASHRVAAMIGPGGC